MYNNFVMGFGHFLFTWQVNLQVFLVVHFIVLSSISRKNIVCN